jgi:hypothetical protein
VPEREYSGGRRRPADAELLIAQVKEEFKKQKDKLGAATAAKLLGVCPASFYNYLRGKSLPDLDVLRKAQDEWGIKWKYIDLSEILRTRGVRSAEQLAFEFLTGVQEEDVEVVKVSLDGKTALRVALKIKFPA